MDGVTRCARYAFGPNKLHYCGPDANREVLAYLREGVWDAGLERILRGFQTLYPYLEQIARANGIRDPFDDRVVEAYWVGNELLKHIPIKTFYRHLVDNLKLTKRGSSESFDQLASKLPKGARMHHSFHVFNVYQRTGNMPKFHTLQSLDACRVSWGKIKFIDGPKVVVERKPLLLNGHSLYLGDPLEQVVYRKLEDDWLTDSLAIGQWITMHWNVLCEVVNESQIRWLEHYTQKHIDLANQTF